MDSKGALKGKAIKYINEHSQQSFAEVTEVTGSVLACRRLFKPRDISGYLNSGGRHEYCGEREFYRSNETLTLPTNKVLDTFDIVQLQDYHKGSGLLIRQDYDVLNRTFKPATLPPVCLCKQPLNPDMHFEVCNRCNLFTRPVLWRATPVLTAHSLSNTAGKTLSSSTRLRSKSRRTQAHPESARILYHCPSISINIRLSLLIAEKTYFDLCREFIRVHS